jgi:adenylate cyclase
LGNDALDCFFAMKQVLVTKHGKYQSRHEIAPTFKAGLHYARVTTGDTLNTTARIQGLCNSCQADLLVFGDFLNTAKSTTHTFDPPGEVA